VNIILLAKGLAMRLRACTIAETVGFGGGCMGSVSLVSWRVLKAVVKSVYKGSKNATTRIISMMYKSTRSNLGNFIIPSPSAKTNTDMAQL
jgi:hypothetical protein